MISRRIKCKICKFVGVVEAHDTVHFPPEKVFKLLGKDLEGYLHFQCPRCGSDCVYSPYYFFSFPMKVGCLIVLSLIAWMVIKFIF